MEYTPRSLACIVFVIRSVAEYTYTNCIQIKNFISSDPAFKPLRNTCDSILQWLHAKAIEARQRLRTPVFTDESEVKMWDTKVLSMDIPKGLLRAVFLQWQELLSQGKCWAVWIKISQFHKEIVQINSRDVCSYLYHEFGSKNSRGVSFCWTVNTNQSGNMTILLVPFVMSRSWINTCKRYLMSIDGGKRGG